jgi:hypothetical protein
MLEKDRRYSIKENDHRIEVWANEGLVYAMVMRFDGFVKK